MRKSVFVISRPGRHRIHPLPDTYTPYIFSNYCSASRRFSRYSFSIFLSFEIQLHALFYTSIKPTRTNLRLGERTNPPEIWCTSNVVNGAPILNSVHGSIFRGTYFLLHKVTVLQIWWTFKRRPKAWCRHILVYRL
jgi:hypothetical protein